MPELRFTVRWPDGGETVCYSPSLVVQDHFQVGSAYCQSAFIERSRRALNEASERVRQRYGFPCSRALEQLADIERRASAFGADAAFTITAFHPFL